MEHQEDNNITLLSFSVIACILYSKQIGLWSTLIIIFVIPYSGKVWWVESLVNRLRFCKLKPSKVVVTINNSLADRYSYSPNFFPPNAWKEWIRQIFSPLNFPLYSTFVWEHVIICLLITIICIHFVRNFGNRQENACYSHPHTSWHKYG